MEARLKKVVKSKYFIGSILVTLIYGIMLFMGKIYPFGENTVLAGDLNAQYVHFFCYLKNILLGTKGIFMSWNLGMANHFYSNFFWQLSSPINILVVLFNKSNIYIFMEIIIYIKLLLIFNCFTLYIEKVYNYKKINSILFGIAYTFSSYVIIYYFNIMWLDVLYILPLSVLFINNYIKTGKMYPIILSYIYMLFVQYYMAYSMIIFCSVYYVVMYWLQEKLTKESIKTFMKKTIPLAIATILSVGVAMMVFLPTLKILNQITNIQNQYINVDNLNLRDIFNNFTNKFEYDNTQAIGFAFCGSLMTVLIVSYFINKNVTVKEKIIYSYLLVFLLLPVISPVIYRLWHGGTATHGYNFRYGYLVMFIFATMAFKSYKIIDKNSKKLFIFLYIFFSNLILIDLIQHFYGFFLGNEDYYLKILFSAIIIYGNITLIWINSHYNDNKKVRIITFILLLVFEIADLCLVFHYNNSSGITIEEYKKNDDVIQQVVDEIKIPEVERIIVDSDELGNNSLRYNYSTFYFFVSGRRLETLTNMNKIGYTTKYNSFTKDYKTFVTDMMSGIKYYIINTYSEDEKIESNIQFNNLLEFVKKIDDNNYLYRNNYCFPFVYYMPKNIEIGENENVFEVQNGILNNYGKETNEKYIYNIYDKNDIITYKTEKEISSEAPYFNCIIKYELKALKDTEVYLNYDSDIVIDVKNNNSDIFLGDTKLYQLITWPRDFEKEYYSKNSTIHIVSLKKGEKYSFEIQGNIETFDENDIQIYAFDDNKIKNKITGVNQDIFEIQNIGKNDMEGIISLENDGYVCFEISYDEGWHIEVDGKETEKEAIYDVFLGAKLEKGQHDIKIYYIPQGFKEGVTISIVSIILLIILLIVHRKINTTKSSDS